MKNLILVTLVSVCSMMAAQAQAGISCNVTKGDPKDKASIQHTDLKVTYESADNILLDGALDGANYSLEGLKDKNTYILWMNLAPGLSVSTTGSFAEGHMRMTLNDKAIVTIFSCSQK